MTKRFPLKRKVYDELGYFAYYETEVPGVERYTHVGGIDRGIYVERWGCHCSYGLWGSVGAVVLGLAMVQSCLWLLK